MSADASCLAPIICGGNQTHTHPFEAEKLKDDEDDNVEAHGPFQAGPFAAEKLKDDEGDDVEAHGPFQAGPFGPF